MTKRVLARAEAFTARLMAEGVPRSVAETLVREYTEDIAGTAPKAAKAALPSGDVRRVIDAYGSLYRERYGEDPVLGGSAFGPCAALVRQHGATVVMERLAILSKWIRDDAFMARMGFTFSTLQSQWARVAERAHTSQAVAKAAAPADCRHIPRCQTAQSHTQKYLADVRNGSSGQTSPLPITSTRSKPF